jgi:hypothetical protein
VLATLEQVLGIVELLAADTPTAADPFDESSALLGRTQSIPAVTCEAMRSEPHARAPAEELRQEEILWLCEAAHVPVIWATQVLDTLARTGLASRAEITDAASGARAECMMMNKGPTILAAIATLDAS